ncbi:hypothetical protein HK096_001095, partial [Nowakowskiella sp. JEL0078]
MDIGILNINTNISEPLKIDPPSISIEAPTSVESQKPSEALSKTSVSKKTSFDSSLSSPKTVKSLTESMKLNESAAEQWQPQFQHMLRDDARLDSLRRFHNIEDSPYILPADIEEQDRLEIQHQILTHIFGG